MIKDFIEEVTDWIGCLETWQKWLGGMGMVVLFFSILFLIGGFEQTKQVASVPIQIAGAEKQATSQFVHDFKEPAANTIGTFSQAGKDMAKDVSDPISKYTIEFGMTFAGILLVAYIFLVVVGSIKNAFSRIL